MLVFGRIPKSQIMHYHIKSHANAKIFNDVHQTKPFVDYNTQTVVVM